mgnify:CR=1 FL=1|jgi:tRNA(Ile2) C34 agmatinyltransferase TiaS
MSAGGSTTIRPHEQQAPRVEVCTLERQAVTKTCPYCGRRSLVARGQFLTCRACGAAIWRAES